MGRSIVALFAVLLALLLACGGEEPEIAKLERARILVTTAESVNAAHFAPDLLTQAQEALAAAEAEYQKQDKAWFSRSPERAHELAERAAELGRQATELAEAASKEASRAARNALAKGETALVDAEAALASLARCRRQRPVSGLRELGQRLEGLQDRLKAAQSQFDEGSYGQSLETSETLIAESTTYITDARHTSFGAGCT